MSKANREYYDEFSNWYEKKRHDGYHALIDDLESDLLQDLVVDKHCLEVGCGTGLILRRVAPLAKSAVGVDISPGMLEQARERGLDVYEADATSLPFDDDSFDIVYSYKVLAHVQDIRQALDEMTRVTRPGGKLVLEFYNPWSLRFLVKRLAGPQKISTQTTEGAVYTRWDSPLKLQQIFPSALKVLDYAGIRVVTPMAKCHDLPVLRQMLRRLEFRSRDSILKYLGGFLVVILEKQHSRH